jgi:hypothetical protein
MGGGHRDGGESLVDGLAAFIHRQRLYRQVARESPNGPLNGRS